MASEVQRFSRPMGIPKLRVRSEYPMTLLITPTMAASWKQHNVGNRPVNKTFVDMHVKTMLAGKWGFSNDMFCFDKNNRMANGSHRLDSIITSGKSIKAVVCINIDPKDFEHMDQDRNTRTPAVVLGMHGESYPKPLQSTLSFLMRFESDSLSRGGSKRFATHEVIEALETYPNVRRSVEFCGRKRLRNLLSWPMAAGLHYLFSQKDATLADLFFVYLMTGENLNSGDPVLVLRERLQDNRENTAKIQRKDLVIMVIKAWNAMRTRKKVRTFNIIKNATIPKIK